ncbi:SDR family NAD(P)-dependent oxidoreductase [Streptomyces sp. CA-111067]|uniref:SDR family NAD(P)-dependent oxidoreductase n=1 Tax=Streptomyces sp. CA-111067 TaxID=3240046 RepID=UPI003D99E7D6
MRNVVISGGTDGIGRALAASCLSRGDDVLVIGRDPAKGAVFTAGGARARFVRADLSLVAENRRAIAEIESVFPAVDALVLCARHYRSQRRVTTEGFEETFALFYLSRYLLGHGLTHLLEKAGRPVIMNVAGPAHATGAVRWDDLELARGYHGGAALGQGGKLNDLLGVDYASVPAPGASASASGTGSSGEPRRTRYVLFHPGVVATSHSGTYDPETAAYVARMRRSAKPVGPTAAAILARIDAPPAEPLTAFVEDVPLSVRHPSFAPADARRLADLTERLLAGVPEA